MRSPSTRRRAQRVRRTLPFAVSVSVAGAALVAYSITAARWLTWGNSAELAAAAKTLGIAQSPGYPLYTLIAALAIRVPAGGAFLRLSILSAILGAAAVAALVVLTWQVLGILFRTGLKPSIVIARAAGAALAGLVLAASPAFWAEATEPSVHTLGALLVLAALALLFFWLRAGRAISWRALARSPAPEEKRAPESRPSPDADPWEAFLNWEEPPEPPKPPRRPERYPDPPGSNRVLYILWFLFGLALANLVTAALVIPSVIVAMAAGLRRRPGPRVISGCVVFLLLGISCYVYLPLRAAHDPAVLASMFDSWQSVFAHVGNAEHVSLAAVAPFVEVLSALKGLVGRLPTQVPWIVLLLSVPGWVVLWRRNRILFTSFALMFALVLAHSASYRLADPAAYLIPLYAVLAVTGGIGLTSIISVLRFRFEPGRVALVVLPAALAFAVVGNEVATNWERLDRRPRLEPFLHAERVLASLDSNAILIAQDPRIIWPLAYLQHVEERRGDVAVIDVLGRAPHYEKWNEDVDFPTERELAREFGQVNAAPSEPRARDVLPVKDYLALLVGTNGTQRPIYADVSIAAEVFPETAVPHGLVVGLAPTTFFAEVERGSRRGHPLGDGLDGVRWGVRDDPEALDVYAETLIAYGRLFLAQGENEEAIATLENARDVVPLDPLAHNVLGAAYLSAGRLDDAEDSLEEALARGPGKAAVHYNVHRLAIAREDPEEARAQLIRAVELDRRHVGYRIDLSAMYEDEGDFGRAEDVLELAEREIPGSRDITLGYGDYLRRRERFSEALLVYERAQTLGPASVGLLRRLGETYWVLDKVGYAIEVMERVVELQPYNAQVKYELARYLWTAGRTEDALLELEEVFEIPPGMWEAHALYGKILGSMGHYGQARENYETALVMGADGEPFWTDWSEMERASGDLATAEALFFGTN